MESKIDYLISMAETNYYHTMVVSALLVKLQALIEVRPMQEVNDEFQLKLSKARDQFKSFHSNKK